MKGSIRERVNKDGSTSYLCQVPAGRDPVTHKRRFKTGVASTKREANALIHSLLSELETEKVVATNLTLINLIDKWLEVAGPAAPSTRMIYKGMIKHQIEPEIGRIALADLKVSDLDHWYDRLRRGGLAPSTIRKAHNIVRAALSQGLRWEWVNVNVAAMSKPPALIKPVIATPKPSQVKSLVQYLAERDIEFATYIRLAGVTGARPGELCGLQWNDIDFDASDISIRRRIMRSEDGLIPVDSTKTGKPRRIPIDRTTLQWLRNHHQTAQDRAALAGTRLINNAYVFTLTADGATFWRMDSVNRKLQYHRAKLGLPRVSLYSLRHQAATAMIDAGVDPKTASDRLGNSVATILSTYTRGRTEADNAAANLMGSLYD